MKTKDKFFTVGEIHTINHPNKQGFFIIGMTAVSETNFKEYNLHIEIPFNEFYSWFNEEELQVMKQEYAKNFLGL